MIALVQRVRQASVSVSGECLGEIPMGLLVYLGVRKGDTENDAAYISRKVAGLRVFTDDKGKMNLSVEDIRRSNPQVGVLAISQFTLIADTRKGNRPSYNAAEFPEKASQLFGRFADMLSDRGLTVETGQFGAHMEVGYVNDGPVSIIIESPSELQ